jgi:hypothetical protein
MPRFASSCAPDLPGCRSLLGCTPDGPRWARQADLSADKEQGKLVDSARTRRGAFTRNEEYSPYRLYSINRKVPGHVRGSAPDPRKPTGRSKN